MGYEVIHGDSAEVLKTFADDSIHAVVTDPPHGLFFMGAKWDRDLPSQRIFDECLRVLKPGGHIFVMSSERLGCVAGLYMSLRRAGFLVDETQILNWVSLTGMPKSVDVGKVADKEAFRAWLAMHRETVTCPKHDAKADRCPECERIFCEGNLTHHDKRKAESAAVNGMYFPPTHRAGNEKGNAHGPAYNWASAEGGVMGHEERSDACALLTRLLALHWPASPTEQRAHWEACVEEVPEEWDCSAPPGVRVKVGDKLDRPGYSLAPPKGSVYGGAIGGGEGSSSEAECTITAPSTPDACALEGRRASVAPLKPFCYPIIHAQKPCEGSYLANWRKWGTGPVGVGDCRIPFGEDGAWKSHEATGFAEDKFFWRGDAAEIQKQPAAAGRTPSNLLSYGDLLGDLQRYADLSAWCEALGLPEAAAELLEAGLVYAPKPSRAQKEAGLEEFAEEAATVTRAQVKQCRNCGGKRVTPGKGFDCGCDNPDPELVPQREVPRSNVHSTVKPTALCAYLVTLATAPGQTVLDPFCGSGSTGVACALIGRRFIGIELDSEDKGFCEIARARIAHAQDRAAPAAQAPLLEVS